MELDRAGYADFLFLVLCLRRLLPALPVIAPNNGHEGLFWVLPTKVDESRLAADALDIGDFGYVSADLGAFVNMLGCFLRSYRSRGGPLPEKGPTKCLERKSPTAKRAETTRIEVFQRERASSIGSREFAFD